MHKYDELEGTRVVITGAAGILGEWIAYAFARSGTRLMLVDIDSERLVEVGKLSLESGAVHVDCVTADLSTHAGVLRLAETVESSWGAADVLVNNAGIYPAQPLLTTARSEIERLLSLNVIAVFELTQLCAQQMISQQVSGSIVNVSSGAAERPWPKGGPYAASKAAVSMLTRTYAMELAPYNIRVNAVSPGFAPGGRTSDLGSEHAAHMIESTPLSRSSGPDDAPMAILWLCSNDASFATGTTIVTDGGRSAGAFTKESTSC